MFPEEKIKGRKSRETFSFTSSHCKFSRLVFLVRKRKVAEYLKPFIVLITFYLGWVTMRWPKICDNMERKKHLRWFILTLTKSESAILLSSS